MGDDVTWTNPAIQIVIDSNTLWQTNTQMEAPRISMSTEQRVRNIIETRDTNLTTSKENMDNYNVILIYKEYELYI